MKRNVKLDKRESSIWEISYRPGAMNLLVVAVTLVILEAHSGVVTGHGGHDEPQAFSGNPFTNDGCGSTRGCFQCEGECGVNLAWEPDAEEEVVKFWLWGPVPDAGGYASMGITTSADMYSADVYSCVLTSGGELALERYWNPSSGRSPVPGVLTGVSDMALSLEDGDVRCEFTRNMTMEGVDNFFDINNQSYFLILAEGPLNSNGVIAYHNAAKVVSGEVVLSDTISAEAGGDNDDLMKVHGILMVIAWLGLVGIGMTIARYFKPMWPNSKLCGEKVWFAIHRACMVMALLLFVVGFIIIFVHVGGFLELGNSADEKRRFSHAIIGCVTTFLGLLNPLMALCRPHPGTPNRPIFNWAHWGVGTAALLLAVVTIGLALGPFNGSTIIPGLDAYTFYVLVGFIGFHILLWVVFEIVKCSTDSQGRTDDIPLSDKNSPAQMPEESGVALCSPMRDCLHNIVILESEGAAMRTILLIIYSLGAIFVVAFLVITIAIA